MNHEVRSWKKAFFQWSEFMVQLLKKLVLIVLGPSLGVNIMWTKKNDHVPKSECADFFIYMPKKDGFEKNSSLTILLSSFGLHLSSLVKCVKDVVCKSSHNNFYKKKWAI